MNPRRITFKLEIEAYSESPEQVANLIDLLLHDIGEGGASDYPNVADLVSVRYAGNVVDRGELTEAERKKHYGADYTHEQLVAIGADPGIADNVLWLPLDFEPDADIITLDGALFCKGVGFSKTTDGELRRSWDTPLGGIAGTASLTFAEQVIDSGKLDELEPGDLMVAADPRDAA